MQIEAHITGKSFTRITHADLATVPRFLRFKTVQMFYNKSSHEIEEMCTLSRNYLHLIEAALDEQSMICFHGPINTRNEALFHDHSLLLKYFHDELLPNCNAFPGYMFDIHWNSNFDVVKNFTASILQMHKISGCANVVIELEVRVLPIEVISNWLHRRLNDENGIGRERFLQIEVFWCENPKEICDHLITVHHILVILFLFLNLMIFFL